MAYLEAMGVIHRDLRADNVLVDSDRTCKIADFGLAKFAEDGCYNSQYGSCLPMIWTPLDAIESRVFNSKSDIFSYGVLMYEVFTRGDIPNQREWNMKNDFPVLNCVNSFCFRMAVAGKW